MAEPTLLTLCRDAGACLPRVSSSVEKPLPLPHLSLCFKTRNQITLLLSLSLFFLNKKDPHHVILLP